MVTKQVEDVQLILSFSVADIEVLRRIWKKGGYALDETGIIQHIINEYDNAIGNEEYDEV